MDQLERRAIADSINAPASIASLTDNISATAPTTQERIPDCEHDSWQCAPRSLRKREDMCWSLVQSGSCNGTSSTINIYQEKLQQSYNSDSMSTYTHDGYNVEESFLQESTFSTQASRQQQASIPRTYPSLDIAAKESYTLKRQRSTGNIENETPQTTKRFQTAHPENTAPYRRRPQEVQSSLTWASPSRQRMFASPGDGLGCWRDRRVLVPKVDLNNDWNMGVDEEPLMRHYRDTTSPATRQ